MIEVIEVFEGQKLRTFKIKIEDFKKEPKMGRKIAGYVIDKLKLKEYLRELRYAGNIASQADLADVKGFSVSDFSRRILKDGVEKAETIQYWDRMIIDYLNCKDWSGIDLKRPEPGDFIKPKYVSVPDPEERKKENPIPLLNLMKVEPCMLVGGPLPYLAVNVQGRVFSIDA